MEEGRGAQFAPPSPYHPESAGYPTSTAPPRSGGHPSFNQPYNDRGARRPSSSPYHRELAANQTPTGPRAQDSIPQYSNDRRIGPSFGGAGYIRPNKRLADDTDVLPSAKRVNVGDYDPGFNRSVMPPPSRPGVNTSGASAQGPKPTQNSGQELHPRQDNPHPVRSSLVGLLEILEPLENMQQIKNLIKHCKNRIFKVANDIYKSLYDKEAHDRKHRDKQEWKAHRNGRKGDLDVIPISVTRGDRSDPNEDNKNIRPGPQHSVTQEKLCLAVLIRNENWSHSFVYKILTTFSKSEINTRQMRRNIEMNYANIHRTGHDDPSQSVASFTSMNFNSTHPKYKFKSPCFMHLDGQVLVPKGTKRLHVGHLTSQRDLDILDDVLEEEFFRNPPNRRPSTRYLGPVSSTIPTSTAPLRRQTPDALPSSPMLPPPQSRELPQQAPQAEDTVASR
jgi:hypothetical protein